jgi:hypothetical protein
MYVKHLIDKILITLEKGEKTILFILIDKDGTLHRKGDGSVGHGELPLIMGKSEQGHFDALMMTINEDIFKYAGVISMPERAGVECRLTLVFQGPEGIDYSFRVIYGEDSQGPPIELAQILINSVKITQEWYESQLAPKKEEKPWWKKWS